MSEGAAGPKGGQGPAVHEGRAWCIERMPSSRREGCRRTQGTPLSEEAGVGESTTERRARHGGTVAVFVRALGGGARAGIGPARAPPSVEHCPDTDVFGHRHH